MTPTEYRQHRTDEEFRLHAERKIRLADFFAEHGEAVIPSKPMPIEHAETWPERLARYAEEDRRRDEANAV